MPRLLLMDAKWEGEVTLTENLKKHLKKVKPKSLDLFASTQFSELKNFINELKKLKIKVNINKAKRTNAPLQILGCDCYPDSFKEKLNGDIILYIGMDYFTQKR